MRGSAGWAAGTPGAGVRSVAPPPGAVCQHGAVSRVGNEREWRWRIGVASALVGSAGVFAGLRQDLGLGWGLTLVAVTALGAMLAAAAHGILAATTTLEEQPLSRCSADFT